MVTKETAKKIVKTKTLFFTLSPYLFHLISLATLFIFVLSKSYKVFLLYLIIIIFLVYFYRIPNRKCRSDQLDIVSPSDGTILEIKHNENGTKTISIFLSLFDVHIQYIPYSGTIINKIYKSGEFNPAYLLEKSLYNENSVITIRTKYGDLSIKQIAGLLARRIVTEPEIGDHVEKGDIYGMIKLSSRVNLTIPKNCRILVKKGDKVKGCQSVIAKFDPDLTKSLSNTIH